MSDKPLVSVVIPLYNYARYVSDCLKSVLSQTHQNIEVIVIDDCSSDNPKKVIKPFLETDSRLQFHKNDSNRGVSFTRNRGIRMCEGSYICYIDADDMMTLKSIELRLAKLQASERIWVHGRVYDLINGKRVPDKSFHGIQKQYRSAMPKPVTRYAKSVHSQSVLVEREFFKILGMFEEDIHYGEEQDLWRRALAFGYHPEYVSDFVAVHRNHKQQTRFGKYRPRKEEWYKESERRLKIRLKNGITAENTILL